MLSTRQRSGRLVAGAFLGLVALGLSFGGFGTALAQASPADQLNDLATHVDAAQVALASGDVAAAQAEYMAFDSGWDDIEDGVQAQSRANYRAIEVAMRAVQGALDADPVDAEAALVRLQRLRAQCDAFIAGQPPLDDGALASTET